MKVKANLVLIGMMGSGKSSVADCLKNRLSDYDLVDIDSLIEKAENKSVTEIFAQNGEKYFREKETEAVKIFSSKTAQIISTGGGIVENPENINYLRLKGILFYLSAPSNVLYERIKNDNSRPLLKTANPQATLSALLEKRESGYKKADYEIDVKDKTIEQTAREIIQKYEEKCVKCCNTGE